MRHLASGSMLILILSGPPTWADEDGAQPLEARQLKRQVSATQIFEAEPFTAESVAPIPTAFSEENLLASPLVWFDEMDGQATQAVQVAAQNVVPMVPQAPAAPSANAQRFADQFSSSRGSFRVGEDLYSPPDFEGGLIVYGEDVAMKIGGYIKADFIYDFDAIDSTDSFDTTSIPVGAASRTNARFHARQTRLSFDSRWVKYGRTVKIFVEGDFFSDADRFRLRHAYGEAGQLLVGQTWTTFADVSASPSTLDFEGSVSNVNRRQAQARWTSQLFHEDLTLALAVEDTEFIIIPPPGLPGESRSPSPDFVARLRLDREFVKLQLANLYRIGGFQPTDGKVTTGPAWGMNCSGALLLTDSSKAYYQIVFGDGIGSYRGLPDAAPVSATSDELLGMFGWMVGFTKDWNDVLSSNFTYAENEVENTTLQSPADVHRTTYLAANLIWSPVDRLRVGAEYLYGTRENIDGAIGEANRAQLAFIFDLP